MAARRLNPISWTAAGAIVGFVAALDWADPVALRLRWDYLSLGVIAGLFVSIIAAAWPRGRAIPTEPCPRCGHRMPWNVVVCPECGEIR